MNPTSPKAEKSLAGRQDLDRESHDRRVRALVVTMLGLFALSVVISLTAFAYVLVLATTTRHESDDTHNGICALLAQAGTSTTITPEQRLRLEQDDQAFDCNIAPATVRTP